MKHRCTCCGRLLAVGSGDFEIKCPRCKTVNRCRFIAPNAAEHPSVKGYNGCSNRFQTA